MTNTDATAQVVAQAESQGLDQGGAAAVATSTKMSKKRKKQVAALLTLLVILALLFVWYLLNRKPLTELPGLSVAKAPHYQSSIYGMSKPQGVAVTPSGDRIYVTEISGDRVVRAYNRAGKPVGILKPPSSTGAEHTPVYVAINPKNEDVYVSDRLTAKIYVYDAKGKYLRTFAPKGNLGGFAPLGLAFDPAGTLYVTDVRAVPAKSHRIVAFAPDGKLMRSIGAPGQLSFPNGIAVDLHGNIQVSDSNNGRLVVFNVAGKMLATISPGVGEGDLGLPRGVAVDDSGRLYVVDTADHTVRSYDVSKEGAAAPKFIGSFGGEGQLDGTFQYPNGVATDKRSHVYVTDRENNRVQVWGY
jgi:DNA-binding beta-propeller fold protein YncE